MKHIFRHCGKCHSQLVRLLWKEKFRKLYYIELSDTYSAAHSQKLLTSPAEPLKDLNLNLESLSVGVDAWFINLPVISSHFLYQVVEL